MGRIGNTKYRPITGKYRVACTMLINCSTVEKRWCSYHIHHDSILIMAGPFFDHEWLRFNLHESFQDFQRYIFSFQKAVKKFRL